MKPALVLVDIQLDYFPGGRMEVAGAAEASIAAKSLLDFFRQERLPLAHIRHVAARPGATFLLPNTDGIIIHQNVQPVPGETVITKHFPNSFRDTDLEVFLKDRGVKELVICGMMLQMCVDTTVRAAYDKGYTCFVAADACAAKKLAFAGSDIPAAHVHGAYMAALNAVFAKVLNADAIIKLLQSEG